MQEKCRHALLRCCGMHDWYSVFEVAVSEMLHMRHNQSMSRHRMCLLLALCNVNQEAVRQIMSLLKDPVA